MKLLFLYHSVTDVEASVMFYRDIMGWTEAWREGNDTVCFLIPQSETRLLIERDENPKSGGLFEVENVDQFYAENREKLNFIEEPRDIPPGRYAAFQDPAGNVARILDFSHEAAS